MRPAEALAPKYGHRKTQKQRQLNVQEQNALDKHKIISEALYWRKHGIPIGLKNALESKSVNTEKSVYLNYEQDIPGVSTDEGIVLTPEGRFFEFEMDLTKGRSKLLEFCLWEEKTQTIEISGRKPGSGATWGFLALEVLSELNQC